MHSPYSLYTRLSTWFVHLLLLRIVVTWIDISTTRLFRNFLNKKVDISKLHSVAVIERWHFEIIDVVKVQHRACTCCCSMLWHPAHDTLNIYSIRARQLSHATTHLISRLLCRVSEIVADSRKWWSRIASLELRIKKKTCADLSASHCMCLLWKSVDPNPKYEGLEIKVFLTYHPAERSLIESWCSNRCDHKSVISNTV
jgi:hypothetical protein